MPTHTQVDLAASEMDDPVEWDMKVSSLLPGEFVMFTKRYLQWRVADKYARPLYWSDFDGSQTYPVNYVYNMSQCMYFGCGAMQLVQNYTPVQEDLAGSYALGRGHPGSVPVPGSWMQNLDYTIKTDVDTVGALHTVMLKPTSSPSHIAFKHIARMLPRTGGWLPPPPPPLPPPGLFLQPCHEDT